ncbi:MAG: hypothetical protein M9894_18195 [Planctomycetes bacterium]|nr:hypothetical protein [Planctomycetota bacterium]
MHDSRERGALAAGPAGPGPLLPREPFTPEPGRRRNGPVRRPTGLPAKTTR